MGLVFFVLLWLKCALQTGRAQVGASADVSSGAFWVVRLGRGAFGGILYTTSTYEERLC